MSGYAAYARTPVPVAGDANGNGRPGSPPGTPLVLGDKAEPPTS